MSFLECFYLFFETCTDFIRSKCEVKIFNRFSIKLKQSVLHSLIVIFQTQVQRSSLNSITTKNGNSCCNAETDIHCQP